MSAQPIVSAEDAVSKKRFLSALENRKQLFEERPVLPQKAQDVKGVIYNQTMTILEALLEYSAGNEVDETRMLGIVDTIIDLPDRFDVAARVGMAAKKLRRDRREKEKTVE